MQTSYIVTFIGDDRPGLVEALSASIEANGGNWLESRLAQLGGKFTGLVRVSLPDEHGPALETALKDLATSGLSVRVTRIDEPARVERVGRDIHLSVIGPDRPGIVREIAHALSTRSINVVEMESGVSSAPMSAELLFQADIVATIPEATDLLDLQESLAEIANHMALDIDLQ
ncbi:MAG: ACT domain-containing protein [Halioglobus sp.]